MATRAKTITPVTTFGDPAHTVVWTGLLNGDDGDPLEMPGSSDRSFQVSGTPGVGGACVMEGSNDVVPTNWATLNDPQGNPITFAAADITAKKLEQCLEITRHVRPRVTAGDGATAVVVSALVKRRI